jgi:hypothetical protein
LQPLDIGLFSLLASYYSTNLSDFITSIQGYIPVGKREFFSLFWPAFEKAFSKKKYREYMEEGWYLAVRGISPLTR